MGSSLYTFDNGLDVQSKGIPSVRGLLPTPDRDLERVGDPQCLAYHVLYLDRHNVRSSIQAWIPLARVGCRDDRNVELFSVRNDSGRHPKSVVISPLFVHFTASPDVLSLWITKGLQIVWFVPR